MGSVSTFGSSRVHIRTLPKVSSFTKGTREIAIPYSLLAPPPASTRLKNKKVGTEKYGVRRPSAASWKQPSERMSGKLGVLNPPTTHLYRTLISVLPCRPDPPLVKFTPYFVGSLLSNELTQVPDPFDIQSARNHGGCKANTALTRALLSCGFQITALPVSAPSSPPQVAEDTPIVSVLWPPLQHISDVSLRMTR